MDLQSVSDIKDIHLRPGSQVLLRSRGETYLRSFSDLIMRLTKDEGKRGILISTLWSANALSRRINLSKLPSNSLKVIDTISLSLGSDPPSGNEFVFLSTPVSLESILMEIERCILEQKGAHNFLIIDSLNYLSRYFTIGQMGEFFHFLLNRMLEEEMLVVVYDQEGPETEAVSNELSSIIENEISIVKKGGSKK